MDNWIHFLCCNFHFRKDIYIEIELRYLDVDGLFDFQSNAVGQTVPPRLFFFLYIFYFLSLLSCIKVIYIYPFNISITMANTKNATEKVPITCNFCEHSWKTASKHKYVSCPSCLNKCKIIIDKVQ